MAAEEKLKIIRDSPKKFHFKTKDDQRVDIEHRDDDFIYLSLYKWGEEASLQIVLDKVPTPNHTFSGNKIEVENPDFLLRVYPIDTRSTGDFYGDIDDVVQCHDGGLRFELVFKKKRPAAGNSYSFPIAAKNLRCAYQPFLTQEQVSQHFIRPLNVEGSYTFYHASKKGNQYMTGKAVHLYRPIVEDALGNKAWCSLYINPEITELTITIPQEFLDEATYPITLDPDLGYTAIGGEWTFLARANKFNDSFRQGSAWTMPMASTANYIRAYVQSTGADTVDCKAFINQKDSGGADIHGQIAVKQNLACAAAAHWEQFNLAGEVLANGVDYILNIIGDFNDVTAGLEYQVARDTDGELALASYGEIQTYCSEDDPWTDVPDAITYDYSIYVNYPFAPAGWTGKISGVVNPAKIMGVDVANIATVKGVA